MPEFFTEKLEEVNKSLKVEEEPSKDNSNNPESTQAPTGKLTRMVSKRQSIILNPLQATISE